MNDYKGCENCRHKGKREDEFPCRNCTRNCIDKWEPMTNGSRIRQMTDEDLAFVLMCPYDGNAEQCECLGEFSSQSDVKTCIECIKDWLKQPVEEETNE